MQLKKLLLPVLMLFALTAAAKDIKTIVFTTTPQMHCENCENKIKNSVRFVRGVKSIETNVEKQTVTIKYDADKTTPAKIQEGFAKVGYTVKEVKADKEAKCAGEGKGSCCGGKAQESKGSCCGGKSKDAKEAKDANGSCCGGSNH